MSDIDRVNRRRDEGIEIARIEKDKQDKQKFTPLASSDKKILIATFFSYLKKLFNSFSSSKSFYGTAIDRQRIIEHLEKFKALLHSLEQKNLSESADFAVELSGIWVALLDDLEQIEIIERKNVQEIVNFRNFIAQIKSYPPQSEHHLGYYLLQQAGKDWLPFPFIDILDTLHKESQHSKENTLAVWQKNLDQVISQLKISFPFSGE